MIPLETLVEITTLKALKRAGWVREGVPEPESVAAHSWGVAWLVLALTPPTLDRGKCLAYAVLHDLAEVRVGDLTPADGIPAAEKRRREQVAHAALLAGDRDLLAQLEAYDAQNDAEARWVHELDRLDLALQALAYHQAGRTGMRAFVASARAAIHTPALFALLVAIEAAFDLPPSTPAGGTP